MYTPSFHTPVCDDHGRTLRLPASIYQLGLPQYKEQQVGCGNLRGQWDAETIPVFLSAIDITPVASRSRESGAWPQQQEAGETA